MVNFSVSPNLEGTQKCFLGALRVRDIININIFFSHPEIEHRKYSFSYTTGLYLEKKIYILYFLLGVWGAFLLSSSVPLFGLLKTTLVGFLSALLFFTSLHWCTDKKDSFCALSRFELKALPNCVEVQL